MAKIKRAKLALVRARQASESDEGQGVRLTLQRQPTRPVALGAAGSEPSAAGILVLTLRRGVLEPQECVDFARPACEKLNDRHIATLKNVKNRVGC